MRLPYFDFLLRELRDGNSDIATSFGHHVHWGYWDDPAHVCADADDYRRAADRLTQELIAQADLTDGLSVLDVGCGFGGTLEWLHSRSKALQLTGLNIDPRQIHVARLRLRAVGGHDVRFVVGDACALPFPDASFDRLLAVECIFHFSSRETFFREALRVLKPGGRLVLSDFVPSEGFRPVQKLGEALVRKGGPFGAMDFDITLGRYRRLADRTGLALDISRDITANTRPTYGYLKRVAFGGWGARPGLLSAARRAAGNLFFDFARLICRRRILGYWLLSLRKPSTPNPG